MLLDANAAKTLAALILTSMQGKDQLTPQLPLDTVDRGENWLVKGTPYTDTFWQTQNNAFWIFIRKDTAEVVGIGFDASPIRTAKSLERLRAHAIAEQIAWLQGPRDEWEPGGPGFIQYMTASLALYGGLINRPVEAVAYARVLMQAQPALAALADKPISAEERDTVWHVTAPGRGEVMTFSRRTGKLLTVAP